MVYAHILLGFGVVVLAAGLAIYLSVPNRTPPHHARGGGAGNRSRKDEEDEASQGYGGTVKNLNAQRSRTTRVGDSCSVCLEVLGGDNMHMMICGHALHEDCFADWKAVRSTCPICNSRVARLSEPGDQCCICFNPMTNDNMQYLPCEHALHRKCLFDYKENKASTCPLCRKNL